MVETQFVIFGNNIVARRFGRSGRPILVGTPGIKYHMYKIPQLMRNLCFEADWGTIGVPRDFQDFE